MPKDGGAVGNGRKRFNGSENLQLMTYSQSKECNWQDLAHRSACLQHETIESLDARYAVLVRYSVDHKIPLAFERHANDEYRERKTQRSPHIFLCSLEPRLGLRASQEPAHHVRRLPNKFAAAERAMTQGEPPLDYLSKLANHEQSPCIHRLILTQSCA